MSTVSSLVLSFILRLTVSNMSFTVQLVGGSTPLEGRLIVYHKEISGTVCGDGFTDAAARVVCYSLGLG